MAGSSEDAVAEVWDEWKDAVNMTAKEIEDFLEEHGLRFGMKLEEGDDGRLFFVEEEPETAETERARRVVPRRDGFVRDPPAGSRTGRPSG